MGDGVALIERKATGSRNVFENLESGRDPAENQKTRLGQARVVMNQSRESEKSSAGPKENIPVEGGTILRPWKKEKVTCKEDLER